MKTIPEMTEVFFSSLSAMGEKIMGFLPNLVGAILVILIGWLIARFIAYLVSKVLKFAKLDRWNDAMNQSEIIKKSELILDPIKIISRFVFWIVMLGVLIVSFEIMGWEAVTNEIGILVVYLPKLLIAIVIFIIGMYIANLVKELLKSTLLSINVDGAKTISLVAYYIIVILITVTALNQAGIDTQILSNNLTLILGSVLLAFAISFGLGSVDVIKNMLSGFYGKKNFKVGQKVKLEGETGEIVSLDRVSVSIKTSKALLVVPAKEFYGGKVEVLS